MCGRFVSSTPADELARYFGAAPPEESLPPGFNVAPTTDIWAVVEGPDGTRRLEAFHWGLVPVWAKDIGVGNRMINARAESLATSNAYKRAFRQRRCLIPMDGFYEWKKGNGPKAKKQPVFVHRLDGEPLAVAGLWETWRDRDAGPDAPWLHSCTIITTDANGTLRPVHDRMPVVLPPSAWGPWLDPGEDDVARLQGLLVPAPDELLALHPVSTDVNNVRTDRPDLVAPIDPEVPLDQGKLL